MTAFEKLDLAFRIRALARELQDLDRRSVSHNDPHAWNQLRPLESYYPHAINELKIIAALIPEDV